MKTKQVKSTKDGDVLATHVYNFSPNENGGESLLLITKFIANGDPITKNEGVYLNQELTLNSYGNSATITLCGTNLSPKKLRKLANELEIERKKIV
jgi:hypothetical protein